jgi:glyoxylase-like metal-dependent hydrolase (beta-lactamase superfamily II)
MKIVALPVAFEFDGGSATIYPVLLQNNHELLLVDCGYSGFLPLIEREAEKRGVLLKELSGVIVTHHDIDHVGGLFELKEKYPAVKIYTSALDEPYISGKKPSLRLQQAEQLFDSLPENQKEWASQFQQRLRSVRAVPVDYAFAIDEQPSFLPGLQIINTPGHLPGHISIYLPESKTLVAGDALVFENGELGIANPQFTLDMPAAIRSVKKIGQLAPEKIYCYHGGLVEANIPPQLQRIIQRGGDAG